MALGKVYFIGAGPGDPELITVKGRRVIEQADVIIYAGSLVNEKVMDRRKREAVLYNSAQMTLEQVAEVMEQAVNRGKTVARVHSGDPAIFGAIREQMDILKQIGIDFEIIPGVSSFCGAAAVLQQEYTLPGVSQTVILTRARGRTPVPPKQDLRELARHQATMVIFLSLALIDEVVGELMEGYPPDTPVAVIYKATWPDQLVVEGKLRDIADKVKEAGIEKTALVLVGDFLGNKYERSQLYHPGFTHGYRARSR